MTPPRPTLYGIPFSHYCQKTEWGLTQAGIPYDYVSIALPKMRRLPDVTTTGLVPALVVEDQLIEGSDQILQWAARHAAPGTDALYPEGIRAEVDEWEQWAGQEVGPVARREAYRVAYNDPWHLTKNVGVHLLAQVARPIILGVLKHYQVRRHEEADAEAVPRIIIKVASRLRATGTGFLLTDHATAADYAVAALCRPLLYAAPARDYHAENGWGLLEDFVKGVRPRRTARVRKRSIRAKDWSRLAHLASTS